MPLIQNVNVPRFDMNLIHQGDCIRFEYVGASLPQNGFVIKATEQEIKICHSACTGNGTAIASLRPEDIAAGKWRLWWTSDFINILREGTSDDGGSGL